jgi:CheY-like chemotaxis protein
MSKRRSAGSGERVVVVAEDVESIRTLLDRALQMSGFTPVTVPNGKQALEQIVALHPVAAVLDWYMPELDGREVCDQVRALPEIAATPLVLLTGFDTTEAGDSQADAVLGKPFELSELMSLLEKLVSREG